MALSVSGFDHLSLTCRHVAETRRFYETVLGFTVSGEMPQWGMTEMRAGGAHIVLVDAESEEGAWAVSPQGRGENVHHFCLRLDWFDENDLRKRLKDAKLAIEEEDLGDDEGAFYVRDPEGNYVELRGVYAAS
jgi:catechol 2,3-dioxygenase-like lactoylglutathione lyase family enzyme